MSRRFTVVVLPLAEQDLRELHAALEEVSTSTADRVYDRLSDAIYSLDVFARRHPLSRQRRLRIGRVRSYVLLSYRVYYGVVGDQVFVYRVWHAARRPPRGPLL
jgi:plasmid stabilization system protein ParE